MYKVCFNEDNKIIGFNMKNCIRYVNIFDISNVTKEILCDKYIEKLDVLGRRMFLKKHKETGKTVVISSMAKDEFFEDELFEYTKIFDKVQEKKTIYLTNESDKFALNDIIEAKKSQLLNKYECSSCILFESFDNISGENYISGENFLRINSNSKVELNNIKCKKTANVMIYCENNNGTEILLNDKVIEENTFCRTNANNIKLQLQSNNTVDIYSIAVLFK